MRGVGRSKPWQTKTPSALQPRCLDPEDVTHGDTVIKGNMKYLTLPPPSHSKKMCWLSRPAGSSLTYVVHSSEQGNNQRCYTGEEKYPRGAKDDAGQEGEEQTVLSTRRWEKPSSGLGHGGSPRGIGWSEADHEELWDETETFPVEEPWFTFKKKK